MENYKKQNLALIVFKTASKIVLANISSFLPIPRWVDFLFQFGIDFPRDLQEELKKQNFGQISNDEIIKIVSSLNKNEAQKLIDSVLSSDEGKSISKNLTPQQYETARQKLLLLPNELDNILNSIELRSQLEVARRENQRILDANKKYENLKEKLKSALNSQKIIEAYDLTIEMLKINKFDFEIAKVEAKLYKVMWDEDLRGVKSSLNTKFILAWYSLWLILFIGFSIYSISKSSESSGFSEVFFGACLALAISSAIIFPISKTWAILPYFFRQVLLFIGTLMVVIIGLAIILILI